MSQPQLTCGFTTKQQNLYLLLALRVGAYAHSVGQGHLKAVTTCTSHAKNKITSRRLSPTFSEFGVKLGYFLEPSRELSRTDVAADLIVKSTSNIKLLPEQYMASIMCSPVLILCRLFQVSCYSSTCVLLRFAPSPE